MAVNLLWKIGGEAGFGILTTGLLFSKMATANGYHIFDFIEYPSLIRGGHNTYDVLLSEEPVHALKKEVDVLICLNKDTYENHKSRLAPQTKVVYDTEDFEIDDNLCISMHLPFKKLLREENAPHIMMNNIALGASLSLFGWDLTSLEKTIESTFAKKGETVINMNKKMAQLGYDHILKNYPEHIRPLPKRENEEKRLVLSGNDAFSLGAITADCRLYSAYPMTPSSSILTTLAAYAEKVGMVVRHAEDEIAVINTALGSSFAGVRSAAGTSGGGFALMVESISFAGVAEIPIVIFLGQRPGPATGMPTWTEQGDLLFAVHAGHGEFPKIVLAPGDVEEMYALAAESFNLADIYQTPVIVMSDTFLAESHISTSEEKFKLFTSGYKLNRGKITDRVAEKSYLRYKVTDDGISPMLIPGQLGLFYQANSYEHLEDGHTTEESLPRIAQVEKRNRKEATFIKNHFKAPQVFGDLDKAKVILVSWGSNKGPILEALKKLQNQENMVAFIHFTYLYPLDESVIKPLFTKLATYVLVENNSHAQFGRLLRQQTGISIEKRILKYDGRPFWAEDIVNFVNNKIDNF